MHARRVLLGFRLFNGLGSEEDDGVRTKRVLITAAGTGSRRGCGRLGVGRFHCRGRPGQAGGAVTPEGRAQRPRGRCGTVSPFFDRGWGERRWRHIDVGYATCELVADAPRVSCATHGPSVAEVPWARHDSAFSRAFEDLAGVGGGGIQQTGGGRPLAVHGLGGPGTASADHRGGVPNILARCDSL